MSHPLQPTFIILCGKTGSGKSAILHFLSSLNYPVIDLEKIAMHRGSAFGSAGFESPQLSQQAFNEQLLKVCEAYHLKPYVFIEQKPFSIGKRRIPDWFYLKMLQGLMVAIHIPKTQRVQNIIQEYFDTETKRQNIFTAINRLSQRFSKEQLSLLRDLLIKKNYTAFVNEVLDYYDHSCNYQDGNRKPFIEVFGENEYCIEHISNEIIQSLSDKGIMLSSVKQ